MKIKTFSALVLSLIFVTTALAVEVKIKTATQLRDRQIPDRIIMEIPEGATFDAELVEGNWLVGVYSHSSGVSRGMIPKDAVLEPEKLSKLEENYRERMRLKEEQEMRAKGFVKYEGKWVTAEEKKRLEEEKFEKEMIAKGLVKFEGRWITADERDTIIRDRYAKEVTALIAMLKDPTSTVEQKDQAERRLVAIDVKEPVIQQLVAELNGPDRAMRGVAAALLGKIGSKQVIKTLIAALDDEDACAGAATGLGELGDREAVGPLIKALQDEDAVRAAAEALGKIGDVRAVDPLIAVLQDFYEDDATHAAAARALGLIGHQKALQPLKEVMQKDTNPLVREAAREAYAKVNAAAGTPGESL